MKRIAVKLILASLFIFAPMAAAHADSEITVTVDGNLVKFDQPPIIMNSRTMVPFRAISEALGAKVYWDETTQTVDIFHKDKNITLAIGSKNLTINDEKTITMDSPAVIVNSRTLIPVRYVSEALDCKVDWDSSLRRAVVMTDEYVKIQEQIEASRLAAYVDPKEFASTGEYGTNFDKVAGGYYTNKQGFRIEESDYNDMLEKREQIYRQVIESGMSEFDKIKAIHDWVCKNISYNYNYYNNKKTWKPTKYQSEHQTAWAGLILGTAVCAGYSDAFQFLLDGLDIENHYVIGEVRARGGHAWNIVKLDGKYYQVDTTWDDSTSNTVTYGYFLISDSALSNRTWDKENLPKCPENYKWTVPVYNYIMVSSNDSKFGAVSTSTYQATQGETVSITASPNSGYIFDRWEVTAKGVTLSSATSPNASFTMPNGSVSIKAYFIDPSATYSVKTYVNYAPFAKASASQPAAKAGDTVNLSVDINNAKYEFERWDILLGSDKLTLSDINSPNASFTMPACNVSFRAILKQVQVTAYAITISADSPNHGRAYTAYPGRPQGAAVTVTANPYTNYEFDYWEVVSGNVTLSDKNSSSATFTMPAENVSIKAFFKQTGAIPPEEAGKPALTVSENNPAFGKATVTPSEALQGANVQLQAVPNSGYEFDCWEVVSGNVTINDKNLSAVNFVMPGEAVSIKAVFKQKPAEKYTVTVSENNTAFGKAAASPNEAIQRATVVLNAVSNSGYVFEQWEVVSGNVTLSNKNSSTAYFSMPAENVSIKAQFRQLQSVYSVTISVNNSSYGTASADSASSVQGALISLYAAPKDGYDFDYWEAVSGNVSFSGGGKTANTQFTMPAGNVSVKANFKKQPAAATYNVITITSGAGSVVASPQKAKQGETVTLTAIPKSGYEFSHWSTATANLSDIYSASTTFVMPGYNVTVSANYKQVQTP